MAIDVTTLTIGQYIQGKFRNITVTEEALVSALTEAGATTVMVESQGELGETIISNIPVSADTLLSQLTEKQRDLALAGVYVWAATSTSTSSRVSDSDGDWSHSEGGERLTEADKNHFLRLAKALYAKWGLELAGSSGLWGFRGTGFRYKQKKD